MSDFQVYSRILAAARALLAAGRLTPALYATMRDKAMLAVGNESMLYEAWLYVEDAMEDQAKGRKKNG